MTDVDVMASLGTDPTIARWVQPQAGGGSERGLGETTLYRYRWVVPAGVSSFSMEIAGVPALAYSWPANPGLDAVFTGIACQGGDQWFFEPGMPTQYVDGRTAAAWPMAPGGDGGGIYDRSLGSGGMGGNSATIVSRIANGESTEYLWAVVGGMGGAYSATPTSGTVDSTIGATTNTSGGFYTMTGWSAGGVPAAGVNGGGGGGGFPGGLAGTGGHAGASGTSFLPPGTDQGGLPSPSITASRAISVAYYLPGGWTVGSISIG